MTVNTKDAQISELQVLPCPSGWEARLLRRPAFPNPEPERGLYARRFAGLMETLIAEGLQGQFFLQSWKLSSATGNDLISRNVDRWKLKRGLGVWPHGVRPGGWTEESLMNAAAAAFQAMNPVYRCTIFCSFKQQTMNSFGLHPNSPAEESPLLFSQITPFRTPSTRDYRSIKDR